MMLTHLLQCVCVSGAGVEDVHAKQDARQQNVVHVDPVYGEQHGLQPLDPPVLVHAAALLHSSPFLVHWKQAAQHQVALDADLAARQRGVCEQGALTHHGQD